MSRGLVKSSVVIGGGICAALTSGVVMLAGCAKQEAAVPAAPPLAAMLPGGLQPQASILDLMLGIIEPNANDLWGALTTVSARDDIGNHQPRTDKEWEPLRVKALVLIESANLLVTEGRQVARPEQELKEPGGEGDFTPAQAQAAIEKDQAGFADAARRLQIAADALLQAIDRHDASALEQAGGALDEACENCHRKFWYPNAALPPGA